MNWSEYKNHYSAFLAAMFRAEVITFYADHNIPETEVNQPESEKYKLPFFASYSRRVLASEAGGYRTDHGMIETFAGMMFHQHREQFICYHELPLIFAYLEAFLSHSLVAVWKSQPSLLAQTSDYQQRLNKRNLPPNPTAWSQEELAELIEATLFDMFRRSLDAFQSYMTRIGITLTVNIRPLFLGDLKRNLIIHNGGVVNDKFLNSFNPGERDPTYVKGQQLPMDYDYVTTVFNEALQFAEDLFTNISTHIFQITAPLSEHEKVYTRQSLHMQHNPLEALAEKAIRNIGGPNAYLDLRRQLLAKGLDEDQIAQYILEQGKLD